MQPLKHTWQNRNHYGSKIFSKQNNSKIIFHIFYALFFMPIALWHPLSRFVQLCALWTCLCCIIVITVLFTRKTKVSFCISCSFFLFIFLPVCFYFQSQCQIHRNSSHAMHCNVRWDCVLKLKEQRTVDCRPVNKQPENIQTNWKNPVINLKRKYSSNLCKKKEERNVSF